jgi:hypothetical protein
MPLTAVRGQADVLLHRVELLRTAATRTASWIDELLDSIQFADVRLRPPSRPDDQHPVSLPAGPPLYESSDDALFACGSQSVMVDPNPSPSLSARSLPPWASAI